MPNSIANGFKTASTYLDYAVSASNVLVSAAGTVGYAGFVFDIADTETIELDSDITDHYSESGTATQDHIALRPERVTVRGLVGEYKHIVSGKENFVQNATKKLVTLTSYLPVLSQAAMSVYGNLKSLNEAIDKKEVLNGIMSGGRAVGDLFDAYNNINIPQNEQQKAFIYFEALRNSRALFTITTPFRKYTNMAIESIRARQSGNTRDQSDFEISFKKIRYVFVDREKMEQNSQERLNEQKAPETDTGFMSYVNKGVGEITSIFQAW